jgi:hypothetical protein
MVDLVTLYIQYMVLLLCIVKYRGPIINGDNAMIKIPQWNMCCMYRMQISMQILTIKHFKQLADAVNAAIDDRVDTIDEADFDGRKDSRLVRGFK